MFRVRGRPYHYHGSTIARVIAPRHNQSWPMWKEEKSRRNPRGEHPETLSREQWSVDTDLKDYGKWTYPGCTEEQALECMLVTPLSPPSASLSLPLSQYVPLTVTHISQYLSLGLGLVRVTVRVFFISYTIAHCLSHCLAMFPLTVIVFALL